MFLISVFGYLTLEKHNVKEKYAEANVLEGNLQSVMLRNIYLMKKKLNS